MIIELNIILILLTLVYLAILSKPIRETKSNKVIVENKDISIIIPFKNEEDKLPHLLNSLKKLNYKKDNYEVLFVNDNSTDRSKEIVANLISENQNFKLLNVSDKKLPRKKGALIFGIENSKFENLLFTDADSFVNPNWLIEISKEFANSDFIIGFAPLIPANNFISKFSAYENFKNNILNLISLNWGVPTSAIGRNIAFTKNVFNKLGGYNSTMQKETGDDDLLLREAFKSSVKIGFIISPECAVYSNEKTNMKSFLNQKARHVSTSHNYLFSQKVFIGFWHLLNYIILLSPLFYFYTNSVSTFLPILLKIIFDELLFQKFHSIFSLNYSILKTIFFDYFQLLLLPINFINSFRKIDWK